jgi:hypothetical protein
MRRAHVRIEHLMRSWQSITLLFALWLASACGAGWHREELGPGRRLPARQQVPASGTGLAFGRPFALSGTPKDWRQPKVETRDETYYSEIESVYHALADCPLGRRIPPELRRAGTGGRVTICLACEARLEGRRPRVADGD